jgi:hypothetical protein
LHQYAPDEEHKILLARGFDFLERQFPAEDFSEFRQALDSIKRSRSR